MGIIKSAACKKCGLHKRLYIGSGMLGGNLDYIKTTLSEDVRIQLEQWLDTHEYQRCSNANKLGKCEYCGNLDILNELRIAAADGEEFVYRKPCPLCKHEMAEVLTDVVLCPACNSVMELAETGHWD